MAAMAAAPIVCLESRIVRFYGRVLFFFELHCGRLGCKIGGDDEGETMKYYIYPAKMKLAQRMKDYGQEPIYLINYYLLFLLAACCLC